MANAPTPRPGARPPRMGLLATLASALMGGEERVRRYTEPPAMSMPRRRPPKSQRRRQRAACYGPQVPVGRSTLVVPEARKPRSQRDPKRLARQTRVAFDEYMKTRLE